MAGRFLLAPGPIPCFLRLAARALFRAQRRGLRENQLMSVATGASTPALSRLELIAMVGSLIAVNAMAIDVMLPGIQQIGASLGVESENQRQLVITSYFLGFGISSCCSAARFQTGSGGRSR